MNSIPYLAISYYQCQTADVLITGPISTV